MCSNETSRIEASADSKSTIAMRIEVTVIPVSDAERAKKFYGSLGWRLDADFAVGDEFRVVQFTPPGSQCSIHFGKGLTPASPGSALGYLIVSDVAEARAALTRRDVDVSEVIHREGPGMPALKGPDPQRRSYVSFASFKDPDGNTWLLQEITARLPGRVDADQTTFTTASELARALRRAEAAHTEHEKRTGERDAEWHTWYAQYMTAEQGGKQLPREIPEA